MSGLKCNPRQQTYMAVAIALGISVVMFFLYSLTIDFPASYHPDEPSKVDQILTGKRNYNHPQLLLTLTELAHSASFREANFESVLKTGREVSAAMAAIAVFCAMMLGYSHRSWIGLVVCGLLVGLCPALFVHAHFFKEDAALLGGLSVCILGARLTLLARSRPHIALVSILLGVGVGLAFSAKYIGLAAIMPAILACFLATDRRGRWLGIRLAIVILAAGLVFCLANASAFDSFLPPRLNLAALQRFNAEFRHGLTGEKGLALPTPNWFLLLEAIKATMPHLLILGAVAFGYILWKRGASVLFSVYSVFLASFAIVLAFNSIPFARYALPLVMLFSIFGALATSCMAANLWADNRNWWRLGSVVIVAAFTLIQLLVCVQLENQLRFDSRQSLREWVASNVPNDAVLVADAYTHLASHEGDKQRFPSNERLRIVVRVKQFASDFSDDLGSLRQTGVSFVAVSSLAYDRLYVDGVYGRDGSNELWVSRKRFYDELFRDGRLVWQHVSDPQTNAFVSPELRVYDIRSQGPGNSSTD